MAKEKLELVEVSPRDGLQNEPDIVSTENKLALIDHIIASGLRRLEAGSFVNPKKVPQMADGDAVFAGVPKRDDVTYIALALNLRGVERALGAGATEINYAFCASDGFSIRNNGATVEETFAVWPDVVALAKANGARVTATVSTAFGCPFDGEVPVAQVVKVAERCVAQDIFELALADTIGVGAPSDVHDRFKAVKAAIPGHVQLRAHFHNTRDTALANAVAAVEEGCAYWMVRSPASAAARLRRALPATCRPKTCSICSTAWASTPALIWIVRCKRRNSLAACWGARRLVWSAARRNGPNNKAAALPRRP
ncbi:MAG: hydroxymethylglutaryl-CoA lyase [Hyphomonadaceae bacterium JAD_PAG50586_4]|nr:MAG: hydroxymethylglutaryl-CoA lyase [Hyphomonadaceae bacterium JAD_PAG50586_4]